MAAARKIVAIVGTYRKGRVIDTAVSEALCGAEDGGAATETIYLIDRHIEFCTNCRTCMQQADVGRRGRCVLDDEMEAVLQAIDEADGLVLASPVNFYNVTAVTRRFMERLVGHAYWPWGQPAPKVRDKTQNKRAVTITSSACPAFFARIAMPGGRKALKAIAETLGAKVQTSLLFGMVAQSPDATLNDKDRAKAFLAGRRLAKSLA
ncbi:flavodoxin family protein [Anaerobaca lacustris]|uniref:Flavodoxin family protein n=1 Tax=Anaerobaca lacustris TaxID=3044600 RepID=A0AAW6U4A0_9BACT|nr:flavodoxin family protein [Sedimentisphaerales bacterium M17dextr]